MPSMRILRASLIAAIPTAAIPFALLLLIGFVPAEILTSLYPLRIMLLYLLALGSIFAFLYTATWVLHKLRWLSRRILVVLCWVGALALGVALWYTPGEFLLTLGIAAAFSVASLIISIPLVWLWWLVATGGNPSATST